MKNNKKLFIPIIIYLAALSFYTFGYLKSVFGYSFDTSVSKNCINCHSLRKSKARAGTWSVRKDVIRTLDSSEPFRYDIWSCEICHRDKRSGFSEQETTSEKFPSAHPVPVMGREKSRLLADNNKVMYCTNCHDASQADRGVHSKYVTIYRLRSKGYGYGDPDPADDSASIGWDSASYFWYKPFDTAEIIDSTHQAYLGFGRIDHYQTADGGIFKPSNSRAGRELTDFYHKTADTTDDKISHLQTMYFCLTCHDENGFPSDPLDMTTGVADSTAARIRQKDKANFVNGDVSYNFSDGDDRYYTRSDGGHIIQDSAGTKTGLKLGDRLACVECHDSHNSINNQRLIRDDIVDGGQGGDGFFQRTFCLSCHTLGMANRFYTNGIITKYKAETTTSLLPDEDTARVAADPSLAEYHGLSYARACYGFPRGDTEFYDGYSGCHQSPHMPTLFCNGCHIDHYQERGAVIRKSHPVNVDLAAYDTFPGDEMSINDYYKAYADTMEVPLFNNRIQCLTCHNDHPNSVDTGYAPQTQGLLRGDAGTNIIANLDSVKMGIGNNYKNHNPNFNENLRRICTTSAPEEMTTSVFNNLQAMPELCLNCHYRVIGVKNNHGGFTGGGFGMCDKCHSMHGQHPEPDSAGVPVDSTNIIRPLHYGMYLVFDKVARSTEIINNAVYRAYETLWDSVAAVSVETTDVCVDATGRKFSVKQNEHLLHESLQEKLCERCHGNAQWEKLLQTTAANPPPPQVFFYGSDRVDSVDVYYTTPQVNIAYRSKSSHPVDIKGRVVPGSSYSGTRIDLRCSSGTKSSGCHSAHGNNNYAQVNVMCYLGNTLNRSKSVYGYADVPYSSAGTQAGYVSGMHTFCSLCHDWFGGDIRNSIGQYTRHPVGAGVSVLNLYPDASERSRIDSTFFDNLILDFDTNTYVTRPTFEDFKVASTTEAPGNFIITCITCHRQHGSDQKHLRRFSDKAVVECVGCHGKSPDILK